ncbi:RibD C-terminal domain-containing protein [Bosea sp. OK403]|uniref:dihydrofolate reductase family protein n=1 Tax=Bosea sp. OK403 TaxID=1855286 RepID=UPI0008E2612D|nr:dihydrofolate reductase family protein [Bosea sp. OK403]SFI39472.1 RibD C-terminal domain-containing protein [Bosea sp. OK403]
MRKIVAATFLSLDGVMQAPGGPEEDTAGSFCHGGWTFHYWGDAMGELMGKLFDEPFDLLLGRRTYEIFAAHWPYAGDEDPIAKAFNATTKYVATSSDAPLTWRNSVALPDVAADVARLKKQDGPKLLIQGSSVLIQTLLRHDLIDELDLLVFPLVLGKGKRMFGEGTIPVALKLVDSKASSTGVVMSRYRRGGEIRTGSFAQAQPSEAEIARRERMAAKA